MRFRRGYYRDGRHVSAALVRRNYEERKRRKIGRRRRYGSRHLSTR